MKSRALHATPALVTALAVAAVLATCSPKPSLLEQVGTLGTLRVAMINSATTYYRRGNSAAGFGYDLVHRFARDLGLELEVVVVPNRRAAITALTTGTAHMAAGLAINDARRRQVHFTQAYTEVALDVVYNTHTPSPDNLSELNGRLTIQFHNALGHKLARLHPQLTFDQKRNTNPEELMAHVARGDLYATIANANLVAMNQRYYPKLRVAFTLPRIKRRLAWAFPKHADSGLYNKAVAWLARARRSGQVHVLQQRYFAHADRLGFLGGRIFARLVEQRLPQWRDLFQRAARKYGLDWRLLAAMGYQESHWDPDAVSPTGVRGLMMLTQATAEQIGVSNRLDPKQSIYGGARYLIQMHERLPKSIEEPDRTWMALAAYNIGYGHLMDARRLLKARGLDPDLWANVRKALTWLTREQYHDETRYGYAPGHQAVEYVANIRAYYDILKWMTGDRSGEKPEALVQTQPPAEPKKAKISIDSPAL